MGKAGGTGAGGGRWSSAEWRRFCGSWRGGVALVALCLAVYLPGQWTIPPVDRDESRFAQASRQMFESGDYVVPRVQERARLNKPPLIYWLQCASVAVFGDPPPETPAAGKPVEPYLGNIWVFRMPSFLSAIGAVVVTWMIGRRMFDARAAWLGAAFLAVSPVIAWEAHQARAEQLLVLCTVVAQGCLYLVWSRAGVRGGRSGGSAIVRPRGGDKERSPSRGLPPSAAAPLATIVRPSGEEESGIGTLIQLNGVTEPADKPQRRRSHEQSGATQLWYAIGFWIALSAGVMTKGPITPMIAGLTVMALGFTTRRWRWVMALRPLMGVVIVAAMVGPWVYLVGERVGWDVYLRTIWNETIGRSGSAAEGHWGPPGYHLVLLVALMWPGSLLTALAVRRAWGRAFASRAQMPGVALWRRLRAARPSAGLFLLAWVVPSWVVFELVTTKLPHYTMPLYPALCLLSGRAVFAAEAAVLRGIGERVTAAGAVIWLTVGSLLLAVLAFGWLALMWKPAVAVLSTDVRPAAFGAYWMVMLALLGWFAWRTRRDFTAQRFVRISFRAMSALVLLAIPMFHLFLPNAGNLSVKIEQRVRTIDPGRVRPLAAVRYHEDSLVFLRRAAIAKIDLDQVASWIEANPDGIVVMDVKREAALSGRHGMDFKSLLADLRLREIPNSRVNGWNYSVGKLGSFDCYELNPQE